MSGAVDFEERSPVPDVPLSDETGVGGMEEGFCTDELLAFAIGDDEIRQVGLE